MKRIGCAIIGVLLTASLQAAWPARARAVEKPADELKPRMAAAPPVTIQFKDVVRPATIAPVAMPGAPPSTGRRPAGPDADQHLDQLPALTGTLLTATTAVALPAPVGEGGVRGAVLAAQLSGGALSPEQVWAGGAFTIADLLQALERTSPAPVGNRDRVRDGLAEILVTHFPERLEQPETLTADARLRVAEYLRGRRDARAVPLYESILAEIEQPLATGVPALYRLGQHLGAAGQRQQAVTAFLRAEQYSTEPQFLACCLLEAARQCLAAGDRERAEELYGKVAAYGYGWASGLALYDRAMDRIQRGEHQQAQALLRQQITGERSADANVALAGLLGLSYYRAGDFAQAQRHWREALAQYQANPNLLRGEGLEAQMRMVEQYLPWIERWQRQPLHCEPVEILLTVGEDGQVAPATLRVRCYRQVPLAVSAEGGVRVKLGSAWRGTDQGGSRFYFEREVRVQFSAQGAPAVPAGAVVVTSEALPGVALRVPVRVETAAANTAAAVSTPVLR